MTAALCCLALGVAAPASAAVVTINFSGNSAVDGSDGNARTFTATQNGATVNVRATGWSYVEGQDKIFDSYLGSYSQGLGVTSGDENGSGNTHVIDNQNRIDFILLQFDQAVTFKSADFNTYSVNNHSSDSDATFFVGDHPLAWNSALNLDNQAWSALSPYLSNSFVSTGGSSGGVRNINPSNYSGDLWLVAAGQNGDLATQYGSVDGFKFNTLTVQTAVPEPATWSMMILGFGMVGAAIRRRKLALA